LRVLLTGAAGYIGSHVLLALLQEGFSCIALDNDSNLYCYSAIESYVGRPFESVQGSYGDAAVVEPLLSRVDVVVHLAGFKSVPMSIKYPLTFYDTNVADTIKLLKLMEKHSVFKFIFASSSSVYGGC